jgi:hypothetical protein
MSDKDDDSCHFNKETPCAARCMAESTVPLIWECSHLFHLSKSLLAERDLTVAFGCLPLLAGGVIAPEVLYCTRFADLALP